MTTRYQNELNSFRSGIEARTALHKDRVDAVNQALGVKAGKVFENAKKIGDAGTKLIESGIGVSALAPTLAKYTRKGINKFNQVRSQTQEAIDKVKGKAQSLVKDGEAGVKKVANQATEGVEDAQQALNKSGGDVANGNQSLDDVAGRMKSQVMDAQKARDSTISEDVDGGANQSVGGDAAQAKGGQSQAMDDFDAGKSNPNAGSETAPPEADETEAARDLPSRTNAPGQGRYGENMPGEAKYGDQAQAMADRDAGSGRWAGDIDQSKASSETKVAEPVEPDPKMPDPEGEGTELSDITAKADSGVTDATTGVTDATTDITDATTNIASKIGTKLGTKLGTSVGSELTEQAAAGAAGVTLEEGAAATSWLAFLGIPEILAAAGAVAGAVSAGYGIADAIKSGAESKTATLMPTSAPDKGVQVAGQYVVPTKDSIS